MKSLAQDGLHCIGRIVKPEPQLSLGQRMAALAREAILRRNVAVHPRGHAAGLHISRLGLRDLLETQHGSEANLEVRISFLNALLGVSSFLQTVADICLERAFIELRMAQLEFGLCYER